MRDHRISIFFLTLLFLFFSIRLLSNSHKEPSPKKSAKREQFELMGKFLKEGEEILLSDLVPDPDPFLVCYDPLVGVTTEEEKVLKNWRVCKHLCYEIGLGNQRSKLEARSLAALHVLSEQLKYLKALPTFDTPLATATIKLFVNNLTPKKQH